MKDAPGNARQDHGTAVATLAPGSDRERKPRRSETAPRPRKGSGSRSPTGGARGIKRRDVILLVTQMSVMVDTGVPLAEALRGVGRRTSDPKFASVVADVTEAVEAGEPLSRAFARHPRAFPPTMIALIRASEASGTMSKMLARIAAYLTKEHQTIKQVRGAMMYPGFMFLMCLCITVFLLTFILPRFAKIYEGRNATLPGATRFLIGLSDALVDHWPYWILGTVGTALTVLLWRRTAIGRVQLDWLKLHVPILSSVFRDLYLSRGCRTLGTMLQTGVSLLDTIEIVREVTRNEYFDRLWDRIDTDVRHGRPLSDGLYDSPVIPEELAQMIESGEQAGRLGDVCARVADYCEANFDQTVKTSTQFIEPIMIVVMGTVIGFVAIALLTPIFSIGQAISGG